MTSHRAHLRLLSCLFPVSLSVSSAVGPSRPGFIVAHYFPGIAGGFAPPTPDAIHTIDFYEPAFSAASTDQHPVLQVTSSVRESGTPALPSAFPKSLTVASGSEDESAIHDLKDLLKQLPVESPPGSQDIYGLNTSIAWMSDDLQWYNGGPEGCGGGQSEVQADEEHKVKFKRAVEIVNGLVNKAK